MNKAVLSASLSAEGEILLSAEGIHPKILQQFGARKARGSGKYVLPLRLQDFERFSQKGIHVEADEQLRNALRQLAQRDRTHLYLQKAEDLSRKAQHPAWERLLGHQRVGVGYLSLSPRALLVYSPRLGKTPTSIVSAEVLKLERVLVVCPLTLFGTWSKGIKQWSEEGDAADVLTAHGKPPKQAMPLHRQWVLTNPESIARNLAEWEKWVIEQGIQLLVLDESILYKNHKSKRTQAMVRLGRSVERVWLLTGNPTGRYSDQLFGQLQILRPDVFTSYWRFAGDWCFLTETPWATEVSGNKDAEGMRHYLRDLMISRTPQEVPVLPELEFEMIEVELSEQQEQLIEELDLLSQLRNPDKPEEPTQLTNVLQLMTRTAQIVSEPSQLGFTDVPSAKAEVAWDLIERAEKPVLVWFQFVESLTSFAKKLSSKGLRVGEIHGGVGSARRQDVIDQFQSGELDVVCVQLNTGKFGLDLTRARTIIYYDRSFDLDSWIQSTNRGRLIGMAQDQVAAGYVLHGGHSDFLIDKIILNKVTSLAQMSLSDLLDVTRSVSSRKKQRKSSQRNQKGAQS